METLCELGRWVIGEVVFLVIVSPVGVQKRPGERLLLRVRMPSGRLFTGVVKSVTTSGFSGQISVTSMSDNNLRIRSFDLPWNG